MTNLFSLTSSLNKVICGCTLATLLCGSAAFSQTLYPDRHVDLGFAADGALVAPRDVELKPARRPEVTDGATFTSSDLLQALASDTKMPAPGQFANSGLVFFLRDTAGRAEDRRLSTVCGRLDLYSEPSTPETMKADCDGHIFEYVIAETRVTILRDGRAVTSLSLAPGIYLINGSVRKISGP